MGYNVYSAELNQLELTQGKTIINTINAYSYVIACKDVEFRKALNQSDILIADGFPIVLAAKTLHNYIIHKIAGDDIFHYLLKKLNHSSGSCFFLGSSEETLTRIANNLKNDYPRVNAGYFSPPFKKKFQPEENNAMIESINAFCPDILFVGMTAPKQEIWVYENHPFINAKVLCSIGAVFDFYAGTVHRPSEFWISWKLEWLIRFLKEPRRLWKRYFIYTPQFFFHLFKHKFYYSDKKNYKSEIKSLASTKNSDSNREKS